MMPHSNEEKRNTLGEDNIAEQIAAAGKRQELADPDSDLPLTSRLINRVVEAVGAAVLCSIVVIIFANAVARYVLNTSLLWAEEMVLLLVPWLAMTGVFLSVRRGTMIRIDFFYERLSSGWRQPVLIGGYLISIAVLFFLGWVSLNFVRLFGGDVTIYLGLPTGLSTSALAFGAFGAALAFIVRALDDWPARRQRGGK